MVLSLDSFFLFFAFLVIDISLEVFTLRSARVYELCFDCILKQQNSIKKNSVFYLRFRGLYVIRSRNVRLSFCLGIVCFHFEFKFVFTFVLILIGHGVESHTQFGHLRSF